MAYAEHLVAARGHGRISLSYGIDNDAARQLYAGLDYRDAGLLPKPVQGKIRIRGRLVEINDSLIYLVKDLPVDFGRSRSS